MWWMHSPSDVEMLREFSADDPWSGTPRATFRLEAAAWGGIAPAYAVAENSVPRKYTLVSNTSGKHRLPDVLAGLFLSGKLPAEHLPGLLKMLEPSLHRLDYFAHLSLKRSQRRFRLWIGPVIGGVILLLAAALPMIEPEIQRRGLTWDFLLNGALAAAILGGIPWLLMWRLERRRQQQIDQVLQLPVAVQGTNVTPEIRWLSKDDAKNPFNVDGYNCLAFVRAMRSTTKDESVATQFVTLRSSLGQNHAGQLPAGATAIEHRLEYPCGEVADGVLFKAKEMEQKWDIYLYQSALYFCRSWTDELVFVAKFSTTPKTLVVETVWATAEVIGAGREFAVRQLDFLIKNHLFQRSVPHPLPESLGNDPVAIGFYSFSQYGNQCCFGTFGDTLRKDLSKPRPVS